MILARQREPAGHRRSKACEPSSEHRKPHSHPEANTLCMTQKWPLVRFGLFPRSPHPEARKTNP
jgi:hypothetical protein